jgi:predicted P-loop ATPase
MTGDIDVELLRSWRDQLFAEARARFLRGEQWWPEPEFETQHIAPEQAARFEADAWEASIAEFLASRGKHETTIYEVATAALKIETGKIGTANQRRIVKVFQHLGWCRGRTVGGIRRWRRE